MLNIPDLFKAIVSGFTTGITICIPLGPSGIESIKRTAAFNFLEGFKVSLGAIAADISCMILINFGLAAIFLKSRRTEGVFWIISGILLMLFSAFSNEKRETQKEFSFKAFPTGFLITFLNPMTPALWIALTGTILNVWRSIGLTYYCIFIISLILGMISWFALLNYLALKGIRMLNNKTSGKASLILKYTLLALSFGFIIYGVYQFLS